MGDLDGNFVTYVKNNYLYLSQYFKAGITFSDPHTGQKVDFNHLMATLNGLYYATPMPYYIDEEDVDNLCGWAGDLQTAEKYDILPYLNKTDDVDTCYNEATKEIGGTGGHFSFTDMLSDVDAVNIYRISSQSLADRFNNYYSGDLSKRFTRFFNDSYYSYNKVHAYTCLYLLPLYKWPLLNSLGDITENQSYAIATAMIDFINREVKAENG